MVSPRWLPIARLSGLAIAGVLLLDHATSATAIKCSTRSTVEDPFYRGKAASDVYNRFKESHRIPFLPEHVPQGLATWSNWREGSDDDLLLITSYDPDQRYAVIMGIDAKTGKGQRVARIAYSHVGGIAIFEELGWAFVSDEEARKVRRYPLDELRKALQSSDEKMLESVAPDQGVIGSSFLTSHGPTNTLWAGQFKLSAKGGRPEMKSYKVSKNGELKEEDGTWEVPVKTQGVVVTKDFLIYSTSHDRDFRSNLYVVRRGKGETDIDNARLFCFRSPSMSEGVAIYGDDLYVVYESGARKFNPPKSTAPGLAKPPNRPRNIISHLHRAPLASLEELPPRSGPTRPGPIGPDKRKQSQ